MIRIKYLTELRCILSADFKKHVISEGKPEHSIRMWVIYNRFSLLGQLVEFQTGFY